MGNLYNMINGVNPATFLVLPMLDKHPDEYPRFRDCRIAEDKICIYTRTGGPNREEFYSQNQDIRNMPTYVMDSDDPKDSTYAWWTFEVPAVWQKDFELIKQGKIKAVSEAYQMRLVKIYPKLARTFKELFTIKGDNSYANKRRST